jgi:hypothetical protein
MRLIAETCVKEARAAFRADDSTAFASAFSALGMIAMQEIMSHKDSTRAWKSSSVLLTLQRSTRR